MHQPKHSPGVHPKETQKSPHGAAGALAPTNNIQPASLEEQAAIPEELLSRPKITRTPVGHVVPAGDRFKFNESEQEPQSKESPTVGKSDILTNVPDEKVVEKRRIERESEEHKLAFLPRYPNNQTLPCNLRRDKIIRTPPPQQGKR